MQPSTLAKRGSLFLFLAVIAFYLYGLGHFPFVGPDEPRYAQVAREMFLRGDLITPTLGGYTWFEKPALLYWIMIASFKLFGVSEWSARLPSAVSGILTMAAVFGVTRRVESSSSEEHRGLGFWSALAAATTLGIAAFSRAATFDIVLTMTTTWALAFFLLHELEENAKLRRRFLAGFYVFVGLSLLAKGLIGIVIPFGVVGTYFIFRRRLPERKTILSLLWGIPSTLAVAALWYGPVIWKHGWPFVDQFFIQHHFARYVTNKYHHPGPVYYYLLILIPLSLPWSVFFLDGFLRVRTWVRPVEHSMTPLNKVIVFAYAWFLFPLIFFSVSSSKLPGYILPVLPAVALIVGERLTRIINNSTNSSWALRTTGGLCLLLGLVTPASAWRSGNLSLECAVMIAVPLVVAGIFSLVAVRARRASILLIAGAVIAVLLVALHCVGPFAERESAKRLIQLADARGYSQTPIYGLQRDDRTPEFYAAGRVVYGADGEPVIYIGPPQLVNESIRRNEVLLAFVLLADVNQLVEAKTAQTELIGDNGRYALVAVRGL